MSHKSFKSLTKYVDINLLILYNYSVESNLYLQWMLLFRTIAAIKVKTKFKWKVKVSASVISKHQPLQNVLAFHRLK